MLKLCTVIMVFISISFACLITNCPRGGKRSGAITSLENIVRECPSCGADKQGQCFGPRICCGPSLGCLIGTPETHKCRKESLFSRPCIAGYAMCRGNTGRCAANGICCTQESCYVDDTCRITDDVNNDHRIISELNGFLNEGNVLADHNQ
ncbi:neurophysin 1 [Cephus cinctus]|uniref:Neurophysin 1 n=1 Tax=Cephus cinctus TaxID=211228 RepID=A0AAJ7C803_CEPCN|nr:neurophysin 1 [Cephus cinctus]